MSPIRQSTLPSMRTASASYCPPSRPRSSADLAGHQPAPGQQDYATTGAPARAAHQSPVGSEDGVVQKMRRPFLLVQGGPAHHARESLTVLRSTREQVEPSV